MGVNCGRWVAARHGETLTRPARAVHRTTVRGRDTGPDYPVADSVPIPAMTMATPSH